MQPSRSALPVESSGLSTIERLESEVRSYSRLWPTVVRSASGSVVTDDRGRAYLDFFAGAGALNYGHNHPLLKQALISYLEGDGVLHSLDVATEAKVRFLERFDELILGPRGLSYRIQFPGPTGTNAVESALKLARKATGRSTIVAFTNGFHGMTLGSLAATGSRSARRGAGSPLSGVARMPYDGYLGSEVDTLDLFAKMLDDPSSGLDAPAGVLVETTQAEGGINVAGAEWLQRLDRLCQEHQMLLIVDDIQVGCGRTGPFFSFERAGIEPDLVCLSKSISGIGLPMSLVLIAPEHDVWSPGEHNGTFRGNNAAFVTALAALETFWVDDALTSAVERNASVIASALADLRAAWPDHFVSVRGSGMIAGIECRKPEHARAIAAAAFDLGLIIELAGPRDEVVKLLPPLVITETELAAGLDLLREATAVVLSSDRA